MTPIEIHFDRGHGEKTLVLSPQRIGSGGEDDLLVAWTPELVAFAANGADYAAPPFDKGAPVLRSIRAASGKSCDNWKLLLPLAESGKAFLRLLPGSEDREAKTTANWGIWVCESEDFPRFPHLMAVNFPLWAMREGLKDGGPDGAEKLSTLYRAILGAVDFFRACRLIPIRTVAISDLGGNMLRTSGNSLQSTRIGVLGEVVGAWLSMCASTDRVVVAFDPDQLTEAWSEFAGQSRNDEVEFGEAKELRKQNARLCKHLASRINATSPIGAALVTRLKENADLFDSNTPSLLTDLTQSRTLAEAENRSEIKAQRAFEIVFESGDPDRFWGPLLIVGTGNAKLGRHIILVQTLRKRRGLQEQFGSLRQFFVAAAKEKARGAVWFTL